MVLLAYCELERKWEEKNSGKKNCTDAKSWTLKFEG